MLVRILLFLQLSQTVLFQIVCVAPPAAATTSFSLSCNDLLLVSDSNFFPLTTATKCLCALTVNKGLETSPNLLDQPALWFMSWLNSDWLITWFNDSLLKWATAPSPGCGHICVPERFVNAIYTSGWRVPCRGLKGINTKTGVVVWADFRQLILNVKLHFKLLHHFTFKTKPPIRNHF